MMAAKNSPRPAPQPGLGQGIPAYCGLLVSPWCLLQSPKNKRVGLPWPSLAIVLVGRTHGMPVR